MLLHRLSHEELNLSLSVHCCRLPVGRLGGVVGYGVGQICDRKSRLPVSALSGSLGQLSLPSLRGKLIEYHLTGWG